MHLCWTVDFSLLSLSFYYHQSTTTITTTTTTTGLVAWLSSNTFDSINEVAVCWARLVLAWVTACGQVNHLGM